MTEETEEDEQLKLALKLSLEEFNSGNKSSDENGKEEEEEENKNSTSTTTTISPKKAKQKENKNSTSTTPPPISPKKAQQTKWAVYLLNPSGLPASIFVRQTSYQVNGCLLNSQVVTGRKLLWTDRGWNSEAEFKTELLYGLNSEEKKGLIARGQSKEEAEKLEHALKKNMLLATCVNVDFPKTYVAEGKIPDRMPSKQSKTSKYTQVDKKITLKPGGDRSYTVALALSSKQCNDTKDPLFWFEDVQNHRLIIEVLNAPDDALTQMRNKDSNGLTWQARGWRGGSEQFAWCAHHTLREVEGGMRFILARTWLPFLSLPLENHFV